MAGVRGAEAVIGRGQPVARDITDRRPEQGLADAAPHAERKTRVDEDGV